MIRKVIRLGPDRLAQRTRAAPCGGGLVEVLVSIPLLLVFGLGLLQLFLIFTKAMLLQYSVSQSARAIASNALDAGLSGIELVLSQQMVPSYLRFSDLEGGATSALSPPRAVQRYLADRFSGYLEWETVNPTRDSFRDWHEDDERILFPITVGEGAGLRQPKTGVLASQLSLPVGRVSRQTLLDASTLKLRVTQGVPLEIPLVGRLLSVSWRWALGCPSTSGPSRLGALDFGSPGGVPTTINPISIDCLILIRSAQEGRPRIPLSAVGMALLQHPTRDDALGL